MAEIKLLSIKRNTEASYFYNKDSSTTLDSNENKVVQVPTNQPARAVSEKNKKHEEKKSRKERKEREKELKQLEKEKRKSLKSSRKDVVGSVDTSVATDGLKTNSDVKTERDIQVGHDVGESSKGHQDGSPAAKDKVPGLADDSTGREHDEALNQHEQDSSQREQELGRHEEPLKQNVDSSQRHEQVSGELNFSTETNEGSVRENVELIGNDVEHGATSLEHETSIESRGIANEGRDIDESELGFGRHEGKAEQLEETIRPEGAQTTEEAPPDSFRQPVVYPGIPEPTGGEHVEIEISEVVDVDVDPSSSGEVVVSPQYSAHATGPTGESEIVVSTVQHVESSVDVDGFFAEDHGPVDEVDKEEARKSVRFQDETEEIGRSDGESEDHEHASLNLAGDFSETDDSEQKRTLEPTIEIVNKEERQTVESCVDFNDVFASSERQSNDTEAVPGDAERNHSAGSKVNGNAKVNGKTSVKNGQTNVGRFEEIDLNGSNERKNTAATKKGKRKRSKIMRCCFP